MTHQAPLPLRNRVQLVDMGYVRAHLGLDTDGVVALVESGQYRWVWDIGVHDAAASRSIPEYRFWINELPSPAVYRDLTPARVVAEVIGHHRPRLSRGELVHLFVTNRPTIKKMCDAGELQADAGDRHYVTRASLEAFLTRRLL